MQKKVILSTLVAGAILVGCGSSSSTTEAIVSYLDKVASEGVVLPYTVLDNTIEDGAKAGSTMEVRNGGFGSAAAAHPTNINQFYALTDRGPNATYTGDDGKGKMFPTPDYTPRIGLFEIQADGSVKQVKEILLKDREGNNISGLPNTSALGGTGETPYDKNGNTIRNANGEIKLDDFGLDGEGLAVLSDGTFWVSDEYGPHIVHFDSNGKEIDRINAFTNDTRTRCNLPAEFGNRWANRGMEGLTITPDEKTLVGIMQSTLDNPSKDVRSNMTRIVTIDVSTCETKQYLYQQEKNENSNSEIVALSNDTFLVIERDGAFYGSTPTAQKHIYKIKLSTGKELENATLGAGMLQDAALGLTLNGKTLEEVVFEDGWETLRDVGIYPVSKTLVVDMVDKVGYPHDKMEGLIVFNDSTLGVLNDDDFATWSTGGVLEQKYLDEAKTKVDGNTLYIVNNLDLSAN
ncbi:MAG: esterase-like activity of phytase family protein [Campylobacterales bacterium]|nr:esterase-like activity of phytase family protein [Campylobacterales bacterium]